MRARFGSYTLDSTTRELRCGDETLHLSTKAFDLLQQLVEAAPRVLTKRDILDRVWAETNISDGTLAAVIAELRSALGDDAKKPEFIRTVHRIGYSFCAKLAAPSGIRSGVQREYRLIWGAREIHLTRGANVLGRDRTAVAWVDDPSISRRHAIITITDTDATIEDLDSKNGTFVAGSRVRGSQSLVDGDAVMLGRVPMTFRIFHGGLPTEPVGSA